MKTVPPAVRRMIVAAVVTVATGCFVVPPEEQTAALPPQAGSEASGSAVSGPPGTVTHDDPSAVLSVEAAPATDLVPPNPPPPAVPQVRSDAFRAAAADDITTESLGQFYDESFRPFQGPGSRFSVPVQTPIPRGDTERELRTVTDAHELAANLSVWGIGASVQHQESTQFAFYRAIYIESAVQIPLDFVIPQAPARARYYVSAVYVGRLYEHVLWGDASRLGGGLTLESLGGSGIGGWTARERIHSRARTVGLAPRTPDAIFARTDDEMRQAYVESGAPRPVLVRYSVVPASSRPTVSGPRRFRVTIASVRFPSGSWDVGSPPDIRFTVTQQGTVIPGPTRWTDNSAEVTFNYRIVVPITVSANAPLQFAFRDEDPIANDPAGSISIAELTQTPPSAMPPDGEVRLFRSANGIVLTLRLEDANPD